MTPTGILCVEDNYSDDKANEISKLIKDYNKKHNTEWTIKIVGGTSQRGISIQHIKQIIDVIIDKFKDYSDRYIFGRDSKYEFDIDKDL